MAAALTVSVSTVETTPFEDQKPGTSGLRKKVTVFQQENYLENFIHATLATQELQGKTLVLGGDGRYYNDVAIQTILRQCAAFGVRKVYVGQHGLFCTPAVSNAIRTLQCEGGIILTASHNPGGPTEDFGVKYNVSNGGPAPSEVTSAIFEYSKTISEYVIANELPEVNLSEEGVTQYDGFEVEVIDSTTLYVAMLETIFDFNAIQHFLTTNDFPILVSGLSGVGGPYAKKIFIERFGLPEEYLTQCDPLPDFGGGHPDPNLTYAKSLVDQCYVPSGGPQLGAAFDGDADRNMILGSNFFVSPSDSVAIITAQAQECIPYFSGGLKGVGRSMPTSGAVDVVAKALNIPFYETPTGWKYFVNLLENDMISICGEESFGTGSEHIREKDGPWALLCWLSILAKKSLDTESIVTVEQITKEHWQQYGRNYYTRYDYETVEKAAANTLFDHLREQFTNEELLKSYGIQTADEFSYEDPTNNTVATNQGIRFIFEDGSRIIFRLSGTGSVGATIRMYIDKYDTTNVDLEANEALAELVNVALTLSRMEHFTGRNAPTVIT